MHSRMFSGGGQGFHRGHIFVHVCASTRVDFGLLILFYKENLWYIALIPIS